MALPAIGDLSLTACPLRFKSVVSFAAIHVAAAGRLETVLWI
jgi:hypothetical protein